MRVYEIRLKIFLLEDIQQERTYTVFADYIDSCMTKDEKFSRLHQKNCYKNYSFDQFYPTEKDGIYKKDTIYMVRIRTVDSELADYFAGNLANHYNGEIKGLTRELKVIPKKFISQIYTVTPAVIKCDDKSSQDKKGYWRNHISFEQYESRLKVNLIKKYNDMMGVKLDEEFDLYHQIEILNRKPIAVPYKGIRLLGDKLSIQAADNDTAQKLVYMALGTGICEMNSRGMGFVNYRYL